MPRKFATIVLGLALTPWSPVASAHHNTGAAFDLESEITLQGVVTRYRYRNPHIYFFVRADDGEEWRIEAGPTAIMNRLGWSAETVRQGDRISMVDNPSRRPGKASACLKSASVDGTPLPLGRGEDAFKQLSDADTESGVFANSLSGTTWVTVLAESTAWVDAPCPCR